MRSGKEGRTRRGRSNLRHPHGFALMSLLDGQFLQNSFRMNNGKAKNKALDLFEDVFSFRE